MEHDFVKIESLAKVWYDKGRGESTRPWDQLKYHERTEMMDGVVTVMELIHTISSRVIPEKGSLLEHIMGNDA